ncbi:MAG: DUF4296 domain-containing protein [Nitritalea sp.]
MKRFLLALLLLGLGACSEPDLPEGILDEEKMVELLIDLHLAEGMTSTFPIAFDSARVLYPYLENEVFRKHQIPDSVFHESLLYYMTDLRKINRMYERTIDSLNVKEKLRNP